MNAAGAPQQLQYAPPPAWHRRRRWRWLGLLALIVAIAAVGIGSWKRLEPRVRERWQMIAAQSECLEHEAPAGSVVFYRDADTTYAAKPWTRTGPDSLVVPQEWVQYHGQYVEGVVDFSPAWR